MSIKTCDSYFWLRMQDEESTCLGTDAVNRLKLVGRDFGQVKVGFDKLCKSSGQLIMLTELGLYDRFSQFLLLDKVTHLIERGNRFRTVCEKTLKSHA